VSGIEDLLRGAYQEAARSVRPEHVRPAVVLPRARGQRRSGDIRGRRKWTAFVPLAAAAAVAVVIGGTVAVPHLLRTTSPVPVISAVPGAPPFVVLQPYFGGDSAPSRLVVQAAGTRHVLGFVPAPHGTRWESVAATGSSTTFVAAAGSRGSNCTIRFYTLTLTASGKPAGLRPLNAPKIPGQLTSLAASANGQIVAYGSVQCAGPRSPGTIGVVASGTVRRWNMPQNTSPASVSLTADGTELGYAELPYSPALPAPVHGTAGAWIMPTNSPPGSVLAHSRKIFAARGSGDVVSAVLSPDGMTMYVAAESSRRPNRLTLAAYRPADGALLRTLHTWQNAQGYVPGLAIGGSQLLIWAIYQPSTFQVDLASGRAKPFWVYSPAGEFPEAVAW
jgi:hypothetical protein